MPGPVSPRMSVSSRSCLMSLTLAVLLAIQTLCSRVGLPSHDIFVASKRAPGRC